MKVKKSFPLWFVAALAWFGYHCGAGFASGRQVWLYAAQYGGIGMLAPFIIWVANSAFMFISAEYARLSKAKSYRDMVSIYFDNPVVNKIALFLWDVLIFMAAITVSSSCTAGTGSLLNSIFGIPYWVGCVVFIVFMILLLSFGQGILERVGKFGVPLIITFFVICFAGIFSNYENIAPAMAADPVTPVSTWEFIRMCFIYAITQASFFQALSVLAGRFGSRKDVVKFTISGFCMNCFSMLACYFALMAYYPEIGESTIPMYGIVSRFSGVGGTILTIAYNVVLILAYITTVGGAIAGGHARYTPLLLPFFKKESVCRVTVTLVFMAGASLLSALGLDGILTTVNAINSACRLPVWFLPFFICGPFAIRRLRKKELSDLRK